MEMRKVTKCKTRNSLPMLVRRISILMHQPRDPRAGLNLKSMTSGRVWETAHEGGRTLLSSDGVVVSCMLISHGSGLCKSDLNASRKWMKKERCCGARG